MIMPFKHMSKADSYVITAKNHSPRKITCIDTSKVDAKLKSNRMKKKNRYIKNYYNDSIN